MTNNGIAPIRKLEVDANLEEIVDIKMLMNIMKIISDMKDVEPKTEGIIKRIRDMV